MSYSIEYAKRVYVFNNKGEDIYVALIRQGDNNVWTCDNKQRVKEWYCVKVDTLPELWKYIACRAGIVEGGGLQKSNGWIETKSYTIEEYIKQWRSKVKNAKPLEQILEVFDIDFVLRFNPNNLTKTSKDLLNGTITKFGFKNIGNDWYNKSIINFSLNIDDVEILKQLLLIFKNKKENDFKYELDLKKL